MNYLIRALTAEDERLLWEMLYEALRTDPNAEPPPREIVRQPEFARYVEGWGRAGDQGFVGHDSENGELLGAVWIRETDHDNDVATPPIPKLALAVKPGQRKRGIGAALLTQLVKSTPSQSIISLAVGPGNPAVRLYERFGFKIIQQSDHEVIMQR